MRHDFLTTHRDELILRCKRKEAARFSQATPSQAMDHGVPLFIDPLVTALRQDRPTPERMVQGQEPVSVASEIALFHGPEPSTQASERGP
jgi:hypothetical protein